MRKWLIFLLLAVILASMAYMLQGIVSVAQGKHVLDKIQQVSWSDENAVEKVVSEVNPQQYRFLNQTIKNGNSRDRLFSAYLLSRKGLKEYQAFLVEYLQSDDSHERILAAQMLQDVWANEAGPDSRQILNQSRILLGQGNYKESIRKLTFLLRRKPHFAEAYNQRAMAYYVAGSYDASIQDCRDALELNPWNYTAMSGMGESLLKLSRYNEAAKSFENALEIYPDLGAVQNLLKRTQQLIRNRNKDLA
jgi:tetratricopeptide (TPR) repeat protein